MAACAHVDSSHAHPLARAHCRTARCPVKAANAHVDSSHRWTDAARPLERRERAASGGHAANVPASHPNSTASAARAGLATRLATLGRLGRRRSRKARHTSRATHPSVARSASSSSSPLSGNPACGAPQYGVSAAISGLSFLGKKCPRGEPRESTGRAPRSGTPAARRFICRATTATCGASRRGPVRAVPDRPIDRPVRPADPIDRLVDRLESALPDVLAIVGNVLRDWFHALARATHRRHLCRGCGDTFRVRPPMCCSGFCAYRPEDVDGDACRMEVVHVYHGRGQWSYLEGHPVTLRYYAPDHPAWAGLYFEHSEQ